MSPSVDKAREQFPVLWGITGSCANGCEDGIRMGDDCSTNEDGEFICGHCADAARKEFANELADQLGALALRNRSTEVK